MGLFLATAAVAASLLVLRSVHADVTEALWGVGAQVMQYPGAPDEGVRRLQLNGLDLSFRTQTVDARFEEVLEHYQALCASRDARLDEQLTALLPRHASAPSTPGVLRAIATQAARNESGGYVACLDLGDGPQDLRTLADRFVRFANTGELRDLGEPRYIFARRVTERSEEKTLLLTVWADSGLHLHQMLPQGRADAAGRDPDGVPRPSGSQRILSADEAGKPSSIFVYRVVATSPVELEAFYRRKLPIHGWTIIERHPLESTEIDGIHILSAEKHHRSLTVLTYSDASSRSVLTILASEPS